MKALLQRLLKPEIILMMIAGIVAYGLVKVFHLQAQESLHPLFPWIVKGVPLSFFLSAGYVLLADLQTNSLENRLLGLPRYGFEIIAAAGFVWVLHQVHPPLFIDDAGFILRYLDHFAEGYFYTYNLEDGPAFGISSFTFGLFTGFLSWTHLFSPENSLIAVNYIGLFFTGFLLFRILAETRLSPVFLFFVWLMVMAGSKSYLLMANSGMETTLVSAFVLASIYFFLKKNTRLMWAMLALTAISKLDMVPLVIVVAVFYLIGNFKDFFPISIKNKALQAVLLFGIAPIFLYILFTWIVFGSPLPLSAHSKMFHHYHPEGLFPWFEYFHISPFKASHLVPMLVLFLGHHLIAIEQRKWEELRLTIFGWAFFAICLLYYFYNPGERMMWYYCIPDLLLMAQLGISLVRIFQFFPKITGLSLFCIIILGFFVANWNKMLKEVTYYEKMTGRVEKERAFIGEYVGQVTTANDSIASGHGLIPRKANGYVIDMVGLNNALATEYELRLDYVVKDLHPKWVIMHAYYDVIDLMSVEGYHLNRSFYDIALNWYPAFRLYEHIETPGSKEWLHPFMPDRIEANGEVKQISSILHTTGSQITFRPSSYDSLAGTFLTGIKLTEFAQSFELKVYSGDSLMGQIATGVQPMGHPTLPIHAQTTEVTWDLSVYLAGQKMSKIELRSEEKIILIDPALITYTGNHSKASIEIEPASEEVSSPDALDR